MLDVCPLPQKTGAGVDQPIPATGTIGVDLQKRQPRWDTGLLGELSQVMRDASICGLGQAASNPVSSVIKYFPDLFPGPRAVAAE